MFLGSNFTRDYRCNVRYFARTLPLGEGRHRTEDRFGVAAGHEAEFCSAVIDEVELGIMRSELELPIFVLAGERLVDAPLINGHDRF